MRVALRLRVSTLAAKGGGTGRSGKQDLQDQASPAASDQLHGASILAAIEHNAQAQVNLVEKVLDLSRRPTDRARTAEAGYQAHLAKPVHPQGLLALLEKLHRSAEGRAARPD